MRSPFCLHALKRTKNRMSVCRRNVKRSTLDNYSLNSSKTQLTQKGYGYYRNYDFLDDDEETRVTHIISITAKNDGTYSYVVDWERWGESWITLDLDIETN